MWCTKCKIEYRKGITVCADCGSELVVRDGEYGVNICEVKDEASANEMIKYLNYSGIEEIETEKAETSSGIQILVPAKYEKKAEKLIRGYLLGKEEEKEKAVLDSCTEMLGKETSDDSADEVENETGLSDNADILQEEMSEAEELFYDDVEDTVELLHASNKEEYVKMADKYRDLKFSGITFIIFGILGSIYLALSKFKVIPVEYNIFIFCVLVVLFAAFLVAGVVSCVKSKKYKKLIASEEEKTAAIKEWLEENLTKEMVAGWTDSDASDGENDLLISAHIRTMLVREYANEPVGYLEMIADEYYEEHFYEEE